MYKVRWMVLQLLVHLTFAQDYCAVKCPKGAPHIGCNNSGKFADSCPKDRAMLNLTNVEIDKILSMHNDLRNKIASGKVKKFKGATNMPALVWDEELAKLAELNAKQCKMKHDECRSTKNFRYAGQNLGFRGSSANFEKTSSFIANIINTWYNEIDLAAPADIDKCCNKIEIIGHFLQLLQDQATHVGCAISRYTEGRFKILLMACNYSYWNMLSRPVYVTGASASKCKNNKKHPKFTSLCG